jgi:NADPH-dependent 2,4-dienoyl-CoA reductase/sulfur reductase-like enzyme
MAPLKIVIVGGVAGGASAATRARRLNESAEIVLLDKGPYVSFANCGLPYYIGGRIAKRSKLLVATQDDFKAKFRIDVRTRHEAVRIDRTERLVHVRDHDTGREYAESYDRLILAPGADPVLPGWAAPDASNMFVLRDLPDTDRIKAWLDSENPARAVVVGGGYIGLEMVESLHMRGVATSLVELQPHILPVMDDEMAARLEPVLAEHGVSLYLGVGVEGVDAREGRVVGVRLTDGTRLPADMVIVSVGVRPNVKLAVEAGLETGPCGGIAVNAQLQTSDPNVYAVGDATEVVHLVTHKSAYIPLAGSANRNGRLAGEHAATGTAVSATPVAGTAIVGLFGKAAAMTGLTVKAARKSGIDCQVVYAIAGHHAGYYPGAEQLLLKLVFDPASRRILGAQAVGGKGSTSAST